MAQRRKIFAPLFLKSGRFLLADFPQGKSALRCTAKTR
jgi:hypothetical protein